MDRRARIREYKESARPAGVYRVVHTPSGRTLLGAGADVRARLNRVRAQLDMKSHPTAALQRDWNTDGPDAFTFEVLDVLPPAKEGEETSPDDLRMLEALWSEKLALPDGARY